MYGTMWGVNRGTSARHCPSLSLYLPILTDSIESMMWFSLLPVPDGASLEGEGPFLRHANFPVPDRPAPKLGPRDPPISIVVLLGPPSRIGMGVGGVWGAGV